MPVNDRPVSRERQREKNELNISSSKATSVSRVQQKKLKIYPTPVKYLVIPEYSLRETLSLTHKDRANEDIHAENSLLVHCIECNRGIEDENYEWHLEN